MTQSGKMPAMGVHWFDNFKPSDWIALVAAVVSLAAIAVPTLLFFFERHERKLAESATAEAVAARVVAETQRAEAELANARSILALQQREVDRLERLDSETRNVERRRQAELVSVWAEDLEAGWFIHCLNMSLMPVTDVTFVMNVVVKNDDDGYTSDTTTEVAQVRLLPPTGNQPQMFAFDYLQRFRKDADDPGTTPPWKSVRPGLLPTFTHRVTVTRVMFADAASRKWVRTGGDLQEGDDRTQDFFAGSLDRRGLPHE